MTHSSEYFYGNKISDYGLENGYIDYKTLAKAFDAVMNNDIISNTAEIGYWDMISGYVDNSDEIDDLQDRIDDLNWLITADSSKEDDERIQAQIDELQDKIDELTEAQETTPEIFQYYIVSNNGAEILKEAGEIVFYNDTLDMYVWGVTHWGTSWDYVLTDIKIVKE
jgi:hypothetical protein